MKRWSSLQRQLYQLVDEEIDFQLHLSKYRMRSARGSTDLPRYWISLKDEIIFDYPKQFIRKGEDGNFIENLKGERAEYPYITDISKISDLIREYIDTPKEEIFSKQFENDAWGLADIIKAADRRIGKSRLEQLKSATDSEVVKKIIDCRLKASAPLP